MRFAITLDTAERLIRERDVAAPHHSLVAPTLLRSQLLDGLYRSVRRQEFDRKEAGARLDHMRALKIRLLGDRVLQKTAWDLADRLGWEDTLGAEYVALAILQADALVTLDQALARSLAGVVPVAPYDALFA